MEHEQEAVAVPVDVKGKLGQMRKPRTIVQIAASAVFDGSSEKFRTTALCSDGTVWVHDGESWVALPSIPNDVI